MVCKMPRMAQQDMRVTHYKLNWNFREGFGTIDLIDGASPGARELTITGLKYHDYRALVDMLRNERPVFYNAVAEELYTGLEMSGEEEG